MKYFSRKNCSIIVILQFLLILLTACNSFSKTDIMVTESTPETTYISAGDSSRYVKTVFENVDVEKDIQFSEVKDYKGSQEKLNLDIYQPSGDTLTKRPAIIWIHGGSFTGGDKDKGIIKNLATDFAKMGYVTFSINYRVRENPASDWYGTFMDSTGDAASAVDWLVQNCDKYRVDKEHIALGGYSAGACVAVNVVYKDGTKANWNKKSIFSVIDLSGNHFWLGHADKNDPPCAIIQGTADTTVPFSESETIANALKAENVDYVFHPVNGATHDLNPYYEEVFNTVKKFLYKNLTGIDI